MTSRLGWLDADEAQRRRMMEVVDLFRDEGTVDELGIGSVGDAISNALFPGISVLHTRLRYALFVPWLVQEAVGTTRGSRDATTALRRLEVRLIDSLILGTKALEKDASAGIIGVAARHRLKRMPSTIYSTMLGRWGISMWELGLEGHLRQAAGTRLLAEHAPVPDDPEAPRSHPDTGFAHSLPPPPKGLLESTSFALTPDEAEFLKFRIMITTPGTLLSWLVEHPSGDDATWLWDLPHLAEAPLPIATLVDHARRFHTAIHGAILLYNLMLAERAPGDHSPENYRLALADWSSEVESTGCLHDWDRADFWVTIDGLNPRIHPRTRQFIDAWLDLIERTADVADLPRARALIAARERQIKGGRARIGNRSALERWSGSSGLGRLDFRWHTVRRLLSDLQSATGVDDARS